MVSAPTRGRWPSFPPSPEAFLVPGERALNLGAVVLRLDRLHAS